MKKKVLVVLSGGMDSALCLASKVKDLGPSEVVALTFNYGQRHQKEIEQAKKIASFFQVDHFVLDFHFIAELSSNALVDHAQEIKKEKGIPNTMVLGRNGLMAQVAAIWGYGKRVESIVMGVMELESANSGYRDCSRTYMDLVEKLIRLDLALPQFRIETPLIQMTKYETMVYGHQLGVLEFLLEETLTCYEGILKQGCGKCPACELRHDGIKRFLQDQPDLQFSYKNYFLQA